MLKSLPGLIIIYLGLGVILLMLAPASPHNARLQDKAEIVLTWPSVYVFDK